MLVKFMDEGYILSNKYRKIIFEALTSGENNIMIIAKKHRVFPNIAKKIIKEFEKNELVELKENKYILTEKGEKIAQALG
jgi:Mn-dependent DtxR family transcriptional regulator